MAKIMELFAASLDDFTADYEKLQWDVSFRGEAYPPRIVMVTPHAAALLELFLHGFMQERKEMEAAQE